MAARFGPEFSPPQVWAVEDTSVQLAWGNLPPGTVTVRGGDREAFVEHGGGPGAVDLDGLTPQRRQTVELSWDGGTTGFSVTTLPSPPGELISRFATISDMHLGAGPWGALRSMTDQSGHPVPYPYRCAVAAIDEAAAWGAELLVIKGDAAQHETDADFAEVGRLVDAYPDLPMLLIPGNHDVDGRGGTIPPTVGHRALPFVRGVDSVDLPGVRVTVADTTIARRGRGSLVRTETALLDSVADAPGPSFVGLHHQLQATRIPLYWPVGIGSVESVALLGRLSRLDRSVMISSGHTHRNRMRIRDGVLISEVASTKDWPCVWAGYAVHEGGIRQVVRRVAAPAAIAWAEYSRQALNGLWGMWSPGKPNQRCFSHSWAQHHSLIN
ncbi:MAG: metallophosphoesterase [Actinomycetota bacterium]